MLTHAFDPPAHYRLNCDLHCFLLWPQSASLSLVYNLKHIHRTHTLNIFRGYYVSSPACPKKTHTNTTLTGSLYRNTSYFTDNLSSHTYCCYLCVEHGVALPAACDRCSYSYIYRRLNMESLSWITDDRKQLIYELTLSYCTNRYQEPGTCHSADGMLFKNKQKTKNVSCQ